MRRRGKLGIAAIVGFVAASITLGSSPASAVPITYTETDIASGSLNGVAFTDASILLTMNNDTTKITGGPSLFFNFGTITVSINGGAPATFTDSLATHVFSNQSVLPGVVGFNAGADILNVISASFATYALNTAIGPITGTAAFNSGVPSPTSGGDFVLTGVGAPTFTATIGVVPEPSSLAVFATAIAAFGFLFRRGWRRRA
jgi:hypothetical protein